MKTKKSFKTCCCIATTTILFLLVILYFAVFKPKQPKIMAKPISLTHINFSLFTNIIEAYQSEPTAVRNTNYAGFKYKNSTTSIYYNGSFVGDAPVEAGKIGAWSTKVISTVVDVLADKVVASPSFFPDVFRGALNMTMMSVVGKVILLGLFKLHAKTHMSCDVSIFLWQGNNTYTKSYSYYRCNTNTPAFTQY